MTAKEEFEKLNYQHHITYNGDVRYVNSQKQIYFQKYGKHVLIDYWGADSKDLLLNKKELKAIKHQMQEMGWL